MRTLAALAALLIVSACGGKGGTSDEPATTVPPIGGMYEGTTVVDGHGCAVDIQLEEQPDATFHAVYTERTCEGIPAIDPQALVGSSTGEHELLLIPADAPPGYSARLDLSWKPPDLSGWVSRTDGAPKSMVHVVRIGP